MIWLRTLVLVALWAAAALLAQWLIGDPAGWILFSIAISGMLLWRSWRLHLVSHWASNAAAAHRATRTRVRSQIIVREFYRVGSWAVNR